jgi:hypothetical protein
LTTFDKTPHINASASSSAAAMRAALRTRSPMRRAKAWERHAHEEAPQTAARCARMNATKSPHIAPQRSVTASAAPVAARLRGWRVLEASSTTRRGGAAPQSKDEKTPPPPQVCSLKRGPGAHCRAIAVYVDAAYL